MMVLFLYPLLALCWLVVLVPTVWLLIAFIEYWDERALPRMQQRLRKSEDEVYRLKELLAHRVQLVLEEGHRDAGEGEVRTR